MKIGARIKKVRMAGDKTQRVVISEFGGLSINPSEDVDATLRAVEEQAKERGLRYASEARTGDPADVLVGIAEDQGADVLIVGNKGMHRRVLGSVPNSISHNAPCSVLIVKTT